MELTPLPLKVGQTAKCIATQVSKDADIFFLLIYCKISENDVGFECA